MTHENFLRIKEGRKSRTTRLLGALPYYKHKRRIWIVDSTTKKQLKATILEVEEGLLGDFVVKYWREEGYSSPKEFVEVLTKIYGYYDPNKEMINILFKLGWD